MKLLLAGAAAEERTTLRAIGLDFDLNLAEKKLEEQIIKGKAKDTLGKTIVLGSDIKKMCTDYRLYMKPAKEYIGTIPLTLGAELARFCKEKNIVLSGNTEMNGFYIIAPPRMFKGYLTPKQVFKKTVLDMERVRAKERERIKNEDPILVYKLQEKGYYAIIKSWGDDFSWLRRVYGWFTCAKNIGKVNYWTNTAAFWLVFYIMYKFNWFAAHYNNPITPNWTPSGWTFLSGIISCLVALFVGFWLWDDTMGSPKNGRKHLQAIVTEYETNAKY